MTLTHPHPFTLYSNYLKNTDDLVSWKSNTSSQQQDPLNIPPYLGQNEIPLFLSGVSSLMAHKA